jgi:hypothetical protein
MKKLLMVGTFALSLASLPALAKEPATVGGGHMQHCPTAVEGAKTEIKDAKDGVEITVTATAAAKTEEIRKRAKHVADASKADPTAVAHEGNGHGGGGLGRCEVVLKDTTVTTEDIEGGSRITVKPTKAVDLEWLKKETRERQASNKAGGKGGGKPKAEKAEK